MDHDRLFKELLSNFFADFVDLFLPEIAVYLDTDFAFVPMDKEIFADVTSGDKHEVDLLMKAQFRVVDSFILIHVEHQARSEHEFGKRMFRYYSRLSQKYDLPIYPVVIYSHYRPRRQQPDHYEITIAGKSILQFHYAVIQLNRLSWKEFVNKENPVAAALMAKMRIVKEDRPRVRFECYQLLRRLKMDPARSSLIGGFIDSYLKLTAEEMKVYEREMETLTPAEKEATMALVSDWEQHGIELGLARGIEQGIEKGVTLGKESLVARQIRRRFFQNDLPTKITTAIDRLSSDQLDDLGEALLDFATVADLDGWLARH